MCREFRERFPLASDPAMHHGTCVTHVPWCMSESLTRGGGKNVPGIPGTSATCNFLYLTRGPLFCQNTNCHQRNTVYGAYITAYNVYHNRQFKIHIGGDYENVSISCLYQWFQNMTKGSHWINQYNDSRSMSAGACTASRDEFWKGYIVLLVGKAVVVPVAVWLWMKSTKIHSQNTASAPSHPIQHPQLASAPLWPQWALSWLAAGRLILF